MAERTHSEQLSLDLFVKTCPQCQRELAGWEFAKNKARKDGLQVYCRTCWNTKQRDYLTGSEAYRRKRDERSKRWYQENAERLRPIRRAWAEENADARREYGRRYEAVNRERIAERKRQWRRANPEVARERARRHYEANRESISARHKAWKQANRELVRQQNRAWVDANRDKHNAKGSRRRARMANVQTIDFTPEQLAARWDYYGNRCWVCRIAEAAATDHVKPIAKGGGHMLCNLRPICKACNSAKHAKWPFTPTRSVRHG